ncbi:60 kDa lysophospholipase-like isoform X1 [Astyanax mexicanus]|uniref:60 kDa lysophospholipase-like isoform X1 n=1 Tax=Astyanax mexicanus TaxID=7994 RepID=A0A8T2M205_ASTMX|nr:60 kDa lysophospholipase-like isoform X1 [Astyanax mexicanus]
MEVLPNEDLPLEPIRSENVVIRGKEFLSFLGQTLVPPCEQDWFVESIVPSLACMAVENGDLLSLQQFLPLLHWTTGDYDDTTALHKACELGKLDIVKFLVDKEAFSQLNCFEKNTLLLLAIRNRHLDIVEFLHMKGATVEMHSVMVATEIIQAVKKKDYGLLHAWYLAGVDMDSKDYNGHTAMDHARRLKDEAIVHKLQGYGANLLGAVKADSAEQDSSSEAIFYPVSTHHFTTKQAELQQKENSV